MKTFFQNAIPLFVTPPGGLQEPISTSVRLSSRVRLGGCAGAAGNLLAFCSSDPSFVCLCGLGAGLG